MINPEKSKKNWLKISITTDPALVEAIGDFLVGITGAGVEVGVDDHAATRTINAFLEKENLSEEKTRSLLQQLSDHLRELADIFQVQPPTFTTALVEEEDWGSSWKKHFHPFAIVPGLVIVPTWENYTAQEGEKVIVMDPGMAFGTGHHATTRMSLQFLKEVIGEKKGHKVLDVGTGTGILGMASVLFGAEKVLGIDNDPDAVDAALENVRMNRLDRKMEVAITPLSSLGEEFSVIIANIIHDVLLSMAEDLERLSAKGGQLILSGILQGEQAENIVTHFAKSGFQLEGQKEEGEWAALLFTKTDEGP